jgi:hypothetical protein
MEKKGNMEKKETKPKKVCHSDKEFEELFLPESHEKKNLQEIINEPKKLTEHLTKDLMKAKKK